MNAAEPIGHTPMMTQYPHLWKLRQTAEPTQKPTLVECCSHSQRSPPHALRV